MATTQGVALLRTAAVAQARRHFGATSVCMQQADPIQKLFLDKIKEYTKLAQAGKPPGLNEKDLSDRLNRVKAAYGADKEDFSTFPKFSFKDPELELALMEGSKKEMRLEMYPELEDVYTEGGTFFDNNHGFLKKSIWEKEYEAKYKKEGYMDPDHWNWIQPTRDTKDEVKIYFPEPEKKAVEASKE